jgi:acetylornithine deacetylase
VKAIDHLRALCAIDSTSSRPNAPVLDYLEPVLRQAGLDTQRTSYLDGAGVQKQNLVAWAGQPRTEPWGLALVGHTDCVPFDPEWKEALTLTEREGRLYARGSCDTKGFIAAALTAVGSASAASLRAGLGLIFTADEEVGCVGAKRLAQAAELKPKRALVGEPTSLRAIRANKGYCLAEIELLGQEGHSAYPGAGTSAIRAAGKLLAALEGIDADLRSRLDPGFEPPFTTTNVGLISGGKAKNIIAGHCRLTLEWRPIPGQPPRFVADRVQEMLEGLVKEEPRLRYRLDASRLDLGAATAPDADLVRFIEGEGGLPSGTVSFGTEAAQLAELGAEVVVFGPGDIGVAHRTGEFVPVVELERCAAILGRAIERYAAGG